MARPSSLFFPLGSVALVCASFLFGCPRRPPDVADAARETDGGEGTGLDAGADGGTDAGFDSGFDADAGFAQAPLTVASWNLEWFGDPGFAPTDDELQANNVLRVLKSQPEVDLWGFEEVVSPARFQTLVAASLGFAGVLASDADVVDGAREYSVGEQKVAVMYRTGRLALVGSPKVVLAQSDYAFAGRPPLEVRFHPHGQPEGEDLFVLVLHMKARATADDRSRRESAAVALKSYLDTEHAKDEVIVMGDWNDDVDVSIASANGSPLPSPYLNFVDDALDYTFVTSALSLANVGTTLGYPSTIDHHLVTHALAAFYVPGSAQRIDAPAVIGSSYGLTTSDHYPVESRYRFDGDGGRPGP